MHTPRFSGNDRLAITGMALVNALGNSVTEVWENSLAMRSGLSTVRPLADDPPHFIQAETFVPGQNSYCNVIASADLTCTRQDIDLPPQDFRAMSTSTRLTLLMAKQAIAAAGLAQAGYAPDRVGVFVSQNSGESASTLWDVNLTLRARWLTELAASVGQWSPEQQNDFYQRLVQGRVSPDESTMLCRLNCTAAGSICQRYGFTGPSYSVGAACSSSMAALYTAYTLIQAGSIDAAVVGGAEEGYSPLYFAEFSALGALARPSEYITSPEAHSRPFDLRRNGFILGEGAGLIVLERESCARKRSAPMHGLLTAMGATTNTAGLIEPSAQAQADAIRQSFSRIDYGPEAVDLVECHATATPQGDLAEAQSLAMCFGHKTSPTILSGYKGQIGHTTGASGIISLIHGLCAMQDKVFPGTRNCENPDPALGLDAAKLRVLAAPEAWESPTTGIRRMQLNTFGFGGSCFVAQVEEPNDRQPASLSVPDSLSNATATDNGTGFQGQESVVDGIRMITLPHQGQVWRLGSTTPTWMNELAGLANQPSPAELTALGRRGLWLSPPVAPPAVAVMCCGQGSVWPGMGRALYDTFPAAREAMDRIAKVADWDILGLMDEPSLDKIILTRWQQPYLFLLEYAQAHYLTTLGLTPTVMSGHSLGELIALCLAGVYSPETAWTILDTRSRFMAQLEADATSETGMMSVHCTPDVLDATLKEWPDLHVSNYNSPMQVILSGSRELLQEVRRTLRKRRIPAVLLNVSLAFHHPHMRALRDQSVARLLKLDYHAPRLPMMSNITTGLYPDTKEAIVSYIADLDENSVRWVECVRAMWNTYNIRHFVEVGPADTLCGLVSDIESQAVCVAAGRKDKEVDAMRNAVARLYALGHLPMRAGRGGMPAAQPQSTENVASTTVSGTAQMLGGSAPTAGASGQTAPVEAHIEKVMPIIMQATGYTREELQPDMDLRHDLSIRSSRFPLIMHEAEQQFQIKIRFEDMLGVATIRDLAEVLRALQDATQGQTHTATAAAGKAEQGKGLSQPQVLRYSPRLCPTNSTTDAAPSLIAVQHIIVAGPRCRQVAEALEAYYSADCITPCLHLQEARALCADPKGQHLRRGLVLALTDHNQTTDLSPASAVLTDIFLLIKDFCATKGASFCMVVQQEQTATPNARESDPLLAGLNGLLLAVALEYPDCLCRTVRLHSTAAAASPATSGWIAQVLHSPKPEGPKNALTEGPKNALTEGPKNSRSKGVRQPVQWLFSAGKGSSIRLEPRALHPQLPSSDSMPIRHGDTILVPGGGRGISPYALAALAPLQCTFIVLGRSAASTADDSVASALSLLRQLGSTVVRLCCDVNDPAAVQQAVQESVRQYGRIDGLIHAAGVTRDATIANLDAEAFNAVLGVKYQALWNCLEACRPVGLRYAVAFSSMAAWLGNYGQSNYCAANRAMTALLHAYGTRHHICTRAVWLPPVLGVGMAAHGDMQEQLRLRGLDKAWLHCEELGDMLARELFCGNDADSIWARVLPALPSVLPPASGSHSAQVGQYEHAALFPLVFPLAVDFTPQATTGNTPPAQARFTGGHDFSRYADAWLKALPAKDTGDASASHSPVLYTAPISVLVASLVEAAAQNCPWLCPHGVYDFTLHALPQCSGGVTREAHICSDALQWTGNSATIQRSCNTSMYLRNLSANGRRQTQWEKACQGRVDLVIKACPTGTELAPSALHAGGLGKEELGTDGLVTGGIVTGGSWDAISLPFAVPVSAVHTIPMPPLFPTAWLEACIHEAWQACTGTTTQADTRNEGAQSPRLHSIAAIEWLRPQTMPTQLCIQLRAATPTGEKATIAGHATLQGTTPQGATSATVGQTFDARLSDAQGKVWMLVRAMAFTHSN